MTRKQVSYCVSHLGYVRSHDLDVVRKHFLLRRGYYGWPSGINLANLHLVKRRR